MKQKLYALFLVLAMTALCPADAWAALTGDVYLRYTSSDSLPVTPFMPSQLLDADGNAVEILANAYVEAEGKCVMVLSQPLAAIGSNVFNGCTTLTGIDLPSALTGIGYAAFRGCTGLTGTLALPAGLTAIGTNAFYGCSGLSGTLTLPAGLTSIGSSAFRDCSGLSGLSLSDSLSFIGAYAFMGCSGLSGTLTLPAGITTVSNAAFLGCSGLSGLTLPAGLTTIDIRTFQGCSGLSGTLALPAGVVHINHGAFSGCTGLDRVVLNSIPVLYSADLSSFKNVTAAFTLSLSDRSYVYTDTKTGTLTLAAEPTFVRTMANEWGTIVVPLALNYSRTNGSYRLYRLSYTTGSEMIFAEYEDGETIAAGTPMVIRAVGSRNAEGNFEITLTAADRTYPKGVKAGTASCASDAFTMKGTFAAIEDIDPAEADNTDLYYIAQDKFWHATKQFDVPAFRAWFERATSANGAAPRSYTINIGDGESDLHFVEAEDGTVRFYYDLQGRPVSKDYRGLKVSRTNK